MLPSAKPSLSHTNSSSLIPTATTGVLPPVANSSMIVKNLVKDLSENLNVNGDDFLKEDFDLKTFSAAIIKTKVLSEHLNKLSLNITTLDKEIREQVSLHHEDLLHQAIKIETLEEMLDMVQTRISSLKNTSERLRTKISTPFNELNMRILQLSRLQAACDTLRRIKGILHHASKLRTHMQVGVRDIVKSAQALNELDFLLKNFDSSGIDIIEKDVHYAHKSRNEVEEQAQFILDRSMINQDQSQIGTALQVFYSLGILTNKLADALKNNEKNFQKTCSDLLDLKNVALTTTNSLPSSASSSAFNSSTNLAQFPGRATLPALGQSSQFRAQLWLNMEKLSDTMYDSCSQIYQLQQILEKKKDLLTNFFYLDEIDFGVLFQGKMYLFSSSSSTISTSNQPIDTQILPNDILTFDSICTVIDQNDLNSKKSIELLYEQWRVLVTVLNSSILTSCNASTHIKTTFLNEYPKLLKLQNDLWLRLLQLNPLIDRYRYLSPSLDTNKTKQYLSAYEYLRKCFYDLENSYLNRSLSSLFDPINLIFSQNSDKPINRADVDAYLKGVQSQLQTLQYDIFNSTQSASSALALFKSSNLNITLSGCSSAFSDKIVANICKSIQMYANKSEQVLNSLNAEFQQSMTSFTSSNSNMSSNSVGITGMSNNSGIFSFSSQVQTKNLDYVNSTHDLYDQMTRMFSNEKLNKKLEDKLNGALKTLLIFEENALKPFVLAAFDCILAIILTMHQEDFGNPSSQSCSLYIKELQQVLQRISRDYLQMYNCKAILIPYLNQMSIHLCELFIRHASMLRPMSDSTRSRLVTDSQQIELIIQNLLSTKLTDLGVTYKQLKAFRHLLQTTSPFDLTPNTSSSLKEVVDETHYSNVISESLPYHVLLHYLFSYAPTDFKSPYQSLNWSIARYSEWLDKHQSEKERLLVIKTCLETYVNTVKQKKEKQFATIYPLMFRLLEKGLQNISISSS